jgi:hypothetical protein
LCQSQGVWLRVVATTTEGTVMRVTGLNWGALATMCAEGPDTIDADRLHACLTGIETGRLEAQLARMTTEGSA